MCKFGSVQLASAMGVNPWVGALETDRDIDSSMEQEHMPLEPKDGELCLRSAAGRGMSWTSFAW